VGAVVNHLRVKRFYLVCFSYIVIKGTRGKAQAIRDQMINKGNEKTMCPHYRKRDNFRQHRYGMAKVPQHVRRPQKPAEYNIIFGGYPWVGKNRASISAAQ
jgi:hypothetical protein